MKKSDIMNIINGLKEEYPIGECTLDHVDDAWKLLVGVRLAAQCTDERVNKTTPALFEKFPNMYAMAMASESEIAQLVRPCGFYNSKARDISLTAKMLVTEFNGKVPESMEDLLRLPGVGRKSANLIRGDIFGLPAIVTDTHCIRLCNRIGLVPEGMKDPAKVEMALWKIIPPEEGSDFCHRLVMHGRAVCSARKAECDICCVKKYCRTYKKENTKK